MPPAAAGGYSHNATPWLIASFEQPNLMKFYHLICYLIFITIQKFTLHLVFKLNLEWFEICYFTEANRSQGELVLRYSIRSAARDHK